MLPLRRRINGKAGAMDQTGAASPIDYYPCRYGGSKTVFRGPATPLGSPYAVVLGGSEVFGRYVDEPFCESLADMTGIGVVNLGVHCGGLDVFARDTALTPVIAGARVVVVQAMAACNLSNRFYAVHPRRNDRFLKHSPILKTLFPDVEFCDFAYTRHLLVGLRRASPDKFSIVRRELQEAWTARMRLLLARAPGRVLLLRVTGLHDPELGPEPLLVTGGMLSALSGLYAEEVTVDVGTDLVPSRLAGMAFPETERAAAGAALPPSAHDRIASALADVIGRRGWLAA
jgi:hypothetical protein